MNITTNSPAVARLRTVLRLNAGFSAIGGLIALIAASWVSDGAGIDHVTLTRIVGAGLILFAIDVLLLARASEARLVRDSLLVSVADLSWVAASMVVLAVVDLTRAGVVGTVLVALVVADFAAAQLWFRSKAVGPREAAIVTA